MATVLHLPEQKVILKGVSWETYRRLLVERGNASGTRFTYDRGMLEIMVLSVEHERLKHTIATLVELAAVELGIDVDGVGSTTFRREDLARGFEGDACFYVQNRDRVAGKARLDLPEDPPPDLVIEIDITSPSLDKLPLLAAMDVPEVWRYDGNRLSLLELKSGTFVEAAQSVALPGVTAEALGKLLEESKELKRTSWVRRVRAWAQALRTNNV